MPIDYAWPTAEIAVMGPSQAVEIIFRADIGDPQKLAEREAEYRDHFANPFVAASRGYIDDVIMPHGTRRRIVRALKASRNKQLSNPWKKHDNIPLVSARPEPPLLWPGLFNRSEQGTRHGWTGPTWARPAWWARPARA